MPALHDIVQKGSTDRSVVVHIMDSADGTPETGVVFNTSGIDLWYRREGAARTAVTEATLAALTTAHTDGGFLHVSDGDYRLDLPDAAFATGANYVDFGGTVTGMIVVGGRVRLVDVNLEDSVRAGLTALPNAAAAASGGLFTRGTGAGQINQDANGRIDVNVAAISTDTTAADNLETSFDDTAGAVRWMGIIDQGTAQSATSTTLVLRSAAAFADDELIGSTIQITGGSAGVGQSRLITDYVSSTDTATVETWTTTPTGTITYKIFGTAPGTGAGSGLDAAGVRAALGMSSANLDTQLSTIDTVVDAILVDTGTTLDGKIDTIDTNVDAILVDTGTTLDGKLDTIDNFLDTEVAAILADTNELQTDLADGGRLDLLIDGIKAKTDSLTFTVAGKADANVTHVIADPVVASSEKDTSWGGTA